jgi:hypothetical protein
MLEALAKPLPLTDETSIRAALYLARDHSREDLRVALAEAAAGCKREELRGMAAAALWDASPHADGERAAKMRDRAKAISEELLTSRIIGNVAWAVLIRVASKAMGGQGSVLTETPFRWIQWGWLE